MSKSSGGKNRVCLDCRIKFPGAFTNDPVAFNITSFCPECGKEPACIPDSIRVPKRNQIKQWNNLAKQVFSGIFLRPTRNKLFDEKQWDEDARYKVNDIKVMQRDSREKLRARVEILYKESPIVIQNIFNLLDSNPNASMHEMQEISGMKCDDWRKDKFNHHNIIAISSYHRNKYELPKALVKNLNTD